MKPIIFAVFICFILLNGCKNAHEPSVEKSNVDTTTFFDIKSFFQNEIQQVKATPYFIYRIKTNDQNKKDSTVISTTEFAQVANVFTQFDIRSNAMKQHYSENVFNDLSTKSITLNYTTSQKDLPVKSIDVLLDNEKNTVKRIFIKSIQDDADSSIIHQYSWKAGKSFLITTTILKKQGKTATSQQYVNWNE
ncbi:MAG: hypothetical protein ACOVNY_07435 [Chitinophagaceae bacterium]